MLLKERLFFNHCWFLLSSSSLKIVLELLWSILIGAKVVCLYFQSTLWFVSIDWWVIGWIRTKRRCWLCSVRLQRFLIRLRKIVRSCLPSIEGKKRLSLGILKRAIHAIFGCICNRCWKIVIVRCYRRISIVFFKGIVSRRYLHRLLLVK